MQLEKVLNFFKVLCGQDLIWKILGIRSLKNDLWLHIKLALIIMLIFIIAIHDNNRVMLYIESLALVFLYLTTWRSVQQILQRLEEVEEYSFQCALCKKVKKARAYSCKVFYIICSDCYEKERKT
jgi:hypothetical protein